MVGNHRTITQSATDDLSRYGGVYSVFPDSPHPPHQATTIFSPSPVPVSASTGYLPNLASPSKGDHILTSNDTSTSLSSCPPVTLKMSTSSAGAVNTLAWQSRDPGSTPGGGKKRSSILEDKRKRKCWEVDSASGPKVAIATPTLKAAAKATVPVALTSPTSRRTLSPVAAQVEDITPALPPTLKSPHNLKPSATGSTYPTVAKQKDTPPTSGTTTSSLRAIRPCKTSDPSSSTSSSLPLTSTTTSGIPVGIAVARQRSTSSHIAVTNTSTTSYPDLNNMATTQHMGNIGQAAGLTANGLHSVATSMATGLHSVAGSMGNGQCLPAMTLLTCDDGSASNASTAWASPWHYPVPLESQMQQLSQPSNLQLVRDHSGQFLLLPTASFDSMPRTVVWPSSPGHAGPSLILPHASHPQTTPLILDNRLVALTTPAPQPVPTSNQDCKQRRGAQQQTQQATLVKLEDSPITGVMMPQPDYSKATIGSDANGYAVIHHPSSFINPNFSAISSSSGSFLIQHISRNNNSTMQMSPAPTLFNSPARNNLLISTQQLPQQPQLTLAPPSGDMKDIATICYDNLYHNTTTTTMFNLQQTTSVVNQQTSAMSTSTQQMSTTSILVNDKIGGTYVEPQVDGNCTVNQGSVAYSSQPMEANCSNGDSYITQVGPDACNDSSSYNQSEIHVDSGSSTGNEDSQTSCVNEQEEDGDEEEGELVRTQNDAGNQTDMPEESKAESHENSQDTQDSDVQNSNSDLGNESDKPMSLNNGDNVDKTEEDSGSKVTSEAQPTVPNETEFAFKIDTRHVSLTPIVKMTTPSQPEGTTCDNTETNVSNDIKTTQIVSTLESNTGSTTDVNSKSEINSPSKSDISPENKKKIKQMPSLYPIHCFRPGVKNDLNTENKLIGFKSMPTLEDEHRKEASQAAKTDSKSESDDLAINEALSETALAVNALIGLCDTGKGLENIEKDDKHSCDEDVENNLSTEDLVDDGNNISKQAEVKPIPRLLSVSNLLDKNYSSKSRDSVQDMQLEQGNSESTEDLVESSSQETCAESTPNMETESKMEEEHESVNDSKDEILEVANILCSALFTAKNYQRDEDFDKADTLREVESSRKVSECSVESGVDLSGLELLSNSIEQFERRRAGTQDDGVSLKEQSYDPEGQSLHEETSEHNDEVSMNDSAIARGLDLLCALAHERFLAERASPARDLSPAVRDDSPLRQSVSPRRDTSMSPATLHRAWTAQRLSRGASQSPNRWMMSSDTEDEMFIQPFRPRLYKRPPGVPYKEVSHTYRSLKSEQDTRRVLASKQTYQYVPPTSIDLKEMETRKLLAEIQREFREAQKELTRLTPKKSPHTPNSDSSGGLSWKTAPEGAAGTGCVKRKPGRPRKADKDVESLKHSGKKVRDMINDRPVSPTKLSKDRPDLPRTKLSLTMPATPSSCSGTKQRRSESPVPQVKVQPSPPVLTPFSPLDETESSRPPTLVAHKRHCIGPTNTGSGFYKRRTVHDDLDSEDSDQQEPPQLSPESQAATTCRKRGRPPKKHPPEPPIPEPPVKKPTKPNFVSIVLANKNKQLKSLFDEDSSDYKPNKIRPKLKAEAKVKTSIVRDDSDEDVLSDLEDAPLSITVRKPSLAAASTHVKKIKPAALCAEEAEKKAGSQEPPPVSSVSVKKVHETADLWTKNGKKANGQEPTAVKKAPSHETPDLWTKNSKKANGQEPTAAKKAPSPEVQSSHGAAKKHKRVSESPEPPHGEEKKPVLPKRARRAESGSSGGSVSQCGNSVPSEVDQKECRITVEYLTQQEELKARVLVLNEGLLYAGQLTAISPPDIYGVQLDGERAHRPNIYSQEEVLNDVILEVKPAQSSVKPGKRMCAYWSQQYRCLYPGVVVSETSTSSSGTTTFVNVEFDDGDSGSINVEDIRNLPQDFPLMTYENPLLTLGAATKRKRRNSSTSVDETGPTTKQIKVDATILEENEEEGGGGQGEEEKLDTTRGDKTVELSSDTTVHVKTKQHKIKKRKRSREEKREHKKHKKHKHKHRHKEKRRRSSSTELSNSGGSSVTEEKESEPPETSRPNPTTNEHIKIAIKPIAEIVHKSESDSGDALKITVKKDVTCETLLVSEMNGKVVEKKVLETKVLDKKVGEKILSASLVDEVDTESNDSQVRSDVTEQVEDKAGDMKEDVEKVTRNGDVGTHESLVLTINTSTPCPKIVRDEGRKSLEDGEKPRKSVEDKEKSRKSLDEKEARRKSLEEKEARRKSLEEKEARRKYLEEKEARRKSLEEKEARRKSLEEKEARRKSLEEKEARRKSLEEKEAKRKSLEEKEARRKSLEEKEARRKSLEEKEAKRKSLEEKEARRKSLEEKEARRKSLEEKEARRKSLEEKEARRKSLEEKEARRKSLEEKEARRKSMEEKEKAQKSSEDAEKARKALEEATRKSLEDKEKIRKSLEHEAPRKSVEAEATSKVDSLLTNSENMETREPSTDSKLEEDQVRKDKKTKTHTKACPPSEESKPKSNPSSSTETVPSKPSKSDEPKNQQKEKKPEKANKKEAKVSVAEKSKSDPEHASLEPQLAEEASNESKPECVSKSSNSDEPKNQQKVKDEPKARKKGSKAKERQSSVDAKSTMTHFLPEKQLWDWAGTSYKKCTTKKKGRKQFYKSIQRGDESLSVGDCAVFLSTETDQPYIGKIDGFWESYASMNVRVKWFYHPEETVGCPDTLPCYHGALFEACHFDENDIQTISHKCQVLPLEEYEAKLAQTNDSTDMYYLAGLYDHINRKIHLEPGVEPRTGAVN
ncbi:hypothetical protein M8J77_003810 [Diaphorina citri]|nr:hypothetical protein M8J77_003810 [Diaphorina citri]